MYVLVMLAWLVWPFLPTPQPADVRDAPIVAHLAPGPALAWQDTSNADALVLAVLIGGWSPVVIPRPADGAVIFPLPPAWQPGVRVLACHLWRDAQQETRWWRCAELAPGVIFLPLTRSAP